MRKGILIVAVLLIGLGAVLPFISGMMAEKELDNLVMVISEKTPGVKLTLSNYQRGWFSSTATIRVVLQLSTSQQGILAAIPIPPMSFDVQEDIQHGPIIFNQGQVFIGQALMTSHIVLGPKQQALLALMFTNQKRKPSIQHRLLIKLNGNYVSKTRIPEFTLSTGNKKTNFVWLGYNENFDLSRDLKRITGKSVFDGLHFVSPKIRLEVNAIEFSMNKNEGPYGFWIGDAKFKIPSIRVVVSNVDKFKVKAVNFLMESSISDQLLSSMLKISLEKLYIGGVAYGPVRFSSQIKNVDAVSLDKLKQTIVAIQQANLPDQQLKQRLMALIPNVSQLFAKDAQFELALQFNLPEGLVLLKGHVKLAATKAGTKIDSIPLLVQHIQGEQNVQFPVKLAKKFLRMHFENKLRQHQSLQKALAEQLRQQQAKATSEDAADALKNKPKIVPLSDKQIKTLAIQSTEKQLALWVKNGMLLQVGDAYKLSAKYEKGIPTINGKPIAGLLAAPPPPAAIMQQNNKSSSRKQHVIPQTSTSSRKQHVIP